MSAADEPLEDWLPEDLDKEIQFAIDSLVYIANGIKALDEEVPDFPRARFEEWRNQLLYVNLTSVSASAALGACERRLLAAENKRPVVHATVLDFDDVEDGGDEPLHDRERHGDDHGRDHDDDQGGQVIEMRWRA